MKQKGIDYLTAGIGVALLAAGLFLMKTLDEPQGFLLAFPYICIGVGCGALGHGIASLITRKTMENHPEIQKQAQIDQNDERNIAVANRAKAKAYDMMTILLAVLMVTFALMGVDMTATLLLVFVYLLIQGYAVYYRFKYEKEM